QVGVEAVRQAMGDLGLERVVPVISSRRTKQRNIGELREGPQRLSQALAGGESCVRQLEAGRLRGARSERAGEESPVGGVVQIEADGFEPLRRQSVDVGEIVAG